MCGYNLGVEKHRQSYQRLLQCRQLSEYQTGSPFNSNLHVPCALPFKDVQLGHIILPAPWGGISGGMPLSLFHTPISSAFICHLDIERL
jgi:type IV secretory pathway VirB4 component